MKKVKCIKSFIVNEYDDNGFAIENSSFIVEKDSLWVIKINDFRLIGGEVKLIGVDENELKWLEITTERFEENFTIMD